MPVLLLLLLGLPLAAIAAEEPPAEPDEQHQIKRKFTLPAQTLGPENACQAELGIAYTQMYDKVRVRTTVKNIDCADATGDYTIRIRTLNEAGEVRMRSFEESWAHAGEWPLVITEHYAMDGDTDLVWARVNTNPRTLCLCNTK